MRRELALPFLLGACMSGGASAPPDPEAAAVTDCVLQAATTRELLDIVTGPERRAETMVRDIASRPETESCET